MQQEIERLVPWLMTAKSVVAFTGAGVSTESGIPDFRSPGGVWAKSQPVMYQDYVVSVDAQQEYWRQKSEAHDSMFKAEPNVTHKALARWEELGLLRGVITQNIDELHQRAGSRQVLELHGTAMKIGCLYCDARFEADPMVRDFLETKTIPPCPKCNGLLKHATISFGQALPEDVLQTAAVWAREAEVFLTLGSSLVVYPAAQLPEIAKRSGARLVIINRDPTPLDGIADLVINAPLGEVMEAIEARLYEQQTDENA
ncbi:MAG: Sir2 family NAD-dependent protein deacetylase [Planctomycetaceae bacterium]|nr:Sir2 family NAD-dependent protein deacetylase [Planctomycetaceae bacterium]